ncbi:MAG TPA: hypothetical protein DD437_04655, partial [Rhodobiaceae bacterium]|nr:hypothetical protein [Rhodobiaceae bacterium]
AEIPDLDDRVEEAGPETKRFDPKDHKDDAHEERHDGEFEDRRNNRTAEILLHIVTFVFVVARP